MTLSYDGYNLETDFICGEPSLKILNAKPKLVDADSINGSMFVGMRYGVSTVSFTIAVTGTDAERREKLSTLGGILMVTEPKQLILPDTPDRYYMAVAQGALDLQRCYDGEYATLTFTLTDPVACSITENSATSTNGSCTFTVGGTAPTYINVRAVNRATPEASTHRWGVYLDSMNRHVAYADIGESDTSLLIDSETRRVVASGSTILPAIGSSWLMAEPGQHTVALRYGAGEFYVKWRNRWY